MAMDVGQPMKSGYFIAERSAGNKKWHGRRPANDKQHALASHASAWYLSAGDEAGRYAKTVCNTIFQKN